MNDKLRELLLRYENSKKFADFEFVQEVIDIFIKQYGNKGLKKVVIISELQKGIADFENSIIGINLDYIKSELMKHIWYDDDKLNIYLFNIYVILVLKHEFNHFRQIRKYKNYINSSNLLDVLFVNSFVMICSSNMDLKNIYNNNDDMENKNTYDDSFYSEYHDCLAVERIAQIDACRSIIELMGPIKDEMIRVYYYYLYEYYHYRVKDYTLLDDLVLSPVDKILLRMEDYLDYCGECSEEENSAVDIDEFYDNMFNEYTIQERLRYGLPITIDEYNNTRDYASVMCLLSGVGYNDIEIKKKTLKKKKPN